MTTGTGSKPPSAPSWMIGGPAVVGSGTPPSRPSVGHSVGQQAAGSPVPLMGLPPVVSATARPPPFMTVATSQRGRVVAVGCVQPAGLKAALQRQFLLSAALQLAGCGLAGTMATSVQVVRSATAPPLQTTPSLVAA